MTSALFTMSLISGASTALAVSAPVVSISGGPELATTDATPTVAGTSDAPSGTVVTVTIAGQVLTTALDDGSWSLNVGALSDGTYDVLAYVTDLAGSTGSATQRLTVDAGPPVIVITGGPEQTVYDSMPTIAGTSNADPGSTVTVTVDQQTLSTTVQVGGAWTVTPATIYDGMHRVVASVVDANGTGSAIQMLRVQSAAPLILITGGAARSTFNPRPTISGSSNADAGETLTVTVAGQTLTTTVQPYGIWSVTAGALADGTHSVVAEFTDGRGTGSTTQAFTVDTVATWILIFGGRIDSTNDLTPTIAGRTNADRGAVVTVTVDGQHLSTTVQPFGRWSVTAAVPIADYYHQYDVRVSVTSRGGVGTERQGLTVNTRPAFLTINGGDAESTDDSTPTISGTIDIDVPLGTANWSPTIVTVTVAGQTLTTVASAGTWAVTAGALPDGTYDIVASHTDAEGNIGRAIQALTVDTSLPALPQAQPKFTP